MDAEAVRIAELLADAWGLVQRAQRSVRPDLELATALELIRTDLLAAAFNTCQVQATDDACGAVADIDGALAMLARLPEHPHARAS